MVQAKLLLIWRMPIRQKKKKTEAEQSVGCCMYTSYLQVCETKTARFPSRPEFRMDRGGLSISDGIKQSKHQRMHRRDNKKNQNGAQFMAMNENQEKISTGRKYKKQSPEVFWCLGSAAKARSKLRSSRPGV